MRKVNIKGVSKACLIDSLSYLNCKHLITFSDDLINRYYIIKNEEISNLIIYRDQKDFDQNFCHYFSKAHATYWISNRENLFKKQSDEELYNIYNNENIQDVEKYFIFFCSYFLENYKSFKDKNYLTNDEKDGYIGSILNAKNKFFNNDFFYFYINKKISSMQLKSNLDDEKYKKEARKKYAISQCREEYIKKIDSYKKNITEYFNVDISSTKILYKMASCNDNELIHELSKNLHYLIMEYSINDFEKQYCYNQFMPVINILKNTKKCFDVNIKYSY